MKTQTQLGFNQNPISLSESKSALNRHLILSSFDFATLSIRFLGPNHQILPVWHMFLDCSKDCSLSNVLSFEFLNLQLKINHYLVLHHRDNIDKRENRKKIKILHLIVQLPQHWCLLKLGQ